MNRLILLLVLLLCHARAYTQFSTVYKWTQTLESKQRGGSFYDTVLLDPYAAAKTITTKGGNAVFLMKLAQSVPVSLHSFSTAENCTVYPNPTNGPLTLIIDGFEKEATAEVFSIDGRSLLSHTTAQSRVAMDISNYLRACT